MARQAPRERPAAAKPKAAKPTAKQPAVVKRPAAVNRPAKATQLQQDRAKPKGSCATVPVPEQVTLGDMITILSGVHKMKVGLLVGITPCYFKLKLGEQEVRVKKEHTRVVKECAEEALKEAVSAYLPPKRRINGKQRNPEEVAAALCGLSPLSRKRMRDDEEERQAKRRAMEEKKEEEEARRLVEEEAMRKADEEAKLVAARRKEEEAAAAERQKAAWLEQVVRERALKEAMRRASRMAREMREDPERAEKRILERQRSATATEEVRALSAFLEALKIRVEKKGWAEVQGHDHYRSVLMGDLFETLKEPNLRKGGYWPCSLCLRLVVAWEIAPKVKDLFDKVARKY